MSFGRLISKTLEGQQFIINTTSKVLIIVIREQFNRAGFIFNWKEEYGKKAFGINKSIVNELIENKLKLLVQYHTKEDKKEYWINYNVIENFIEKNSNEFKVSDSKLLHNIPCNLFHSKPTFSGDPN